ncbi:MAG: hypothetical protein NTV59_06605 [Chloroflexi bacterium]|nr:hypothetical protein [Chloroflexota bacterium]
MVFFSEGPGVLGCPCRGTVHCALKVPQDWGIKGVEKRCRIPPAGGLGVSPNLKIPQEWGTKGVEKRLINNLEY